MESSRRLILRLVCLALAALAVSCAHPRLTPPEMDDLRAQFAKAILANIAIDFPDSSEPRVEILSDEQLSGDEIKIRYRVQYIQSSETGGQVQTSRTLDARLARLPEGGFKVVDRKTELQEMDFKPGTLVESAKKSRPDE